MSTDRPPKAINVRPTPSPNDSERMRYLRSLFDRYHEEAANAPLGVQDVLDGNRPRRPNPEDLILGDNDGIDFEDFGLEDYKP